MVVNAHAEYQCRMPIWGDKWVGHGCPRGNVLWLHKGCMVAQWGHMAAQGLHMAAQRLHTAAQWLLWAAEALHFVAPGPSMPPMQQICNICCICLEKMRSGGHFLQVTSWQGTSINRRSLYAASCWAGLGTQPPEHTSRWW